MDEGVLGELLVLCGSESKGVDRCSLEAFAERRFGADASVERLMDDFAPFVARRFIERELEFWAADSALNAVMVAAEWPKAPMRFWEAYAAFEDFEVMEDPEEVARPRIQELLARWAAA